MGARNTTGVAESRRAFVRRAAMAWLVAGACCRADFSVLTYNLNGNGADDWSTNAPQVQAIGREVQFLRPDLLTFNEVPFDQSAQMTNFVAAFLPGYFLARFSGTDGFLRSVILSRFPILREQKWLDGVPLDEFGYAGRFTRDLFEAEIQVPGERAPLHLFTTHLKSAGDADSAARRAAEARAISNFFVTVFLPTHGSAPYMLTGDLNEDIRRPPGASQQPFRWLLDAATGLQLLTPTNPVTGDERTYSARGALSVRFDYILPCAELTTRYTAGVVFRSSVLDPLPTDLLADDDATASDHLPVIAWFRGPVFEPTRVSIRVLTSGDLELVWPTWPGGVYGVAGTMDWSAWVVQATELAAEGNSLTWTVTAEGDARFFRVFQLR